HGLANAVGEVKHDVRLLLSRSVSRNPRVPSAPPAARRAASPCSLSQGLRGGMVVLQPLQQFHRLAVADTNIPRRAELILRQPRHQLLLRSGQDDQEQGFLARPGGPLLGGGFVLEALAAELL